MKLTRFTDGELLLTVKVLELGDDAFVSTRNTSEAIYGLPPATINGVPCGGSLSLSYKIRQPYDFEFLVSLCLVLVIIVVSIAAAYVMTYTMETPKTGWLLIGIFVLLAMATYSLEFPIQTWEAGSAFEGVTFFYNNIANLGIKKSLYQLEGGLYLSTVQNIIMIVGVRILHLGKNLFHFVGSMGVLYLVLCTAPFCSHYFKKYFTRSFRFICSLLIVCYSPIGTNFHTIGYLGVFFLVLLLIYDFEEINNFVYALILLVIPVVCTSKMMFVVFAPLMVIYYLLFRKEINRKKKFCIAIIGISSLMEGVLSLILRQGVQSGHQLGTIQHMPISTFVNKIVYFTLQIFGVQFRCGTSNANQLLANLCSAILVIGILTFIIWQIVWKGRYRREAKFITVLICHIVLQSSVILLTTTAWYGDIDWRQSMSALPDPVGVYLMWLYVSSGVTYLTLLWVFLQHVRFQYTHLQIQFDLTQFRSIRMLATLLVVGTTFFYINQHPSSKDYYSANPTRSEVADWPTYSSMLDAQAYCIQISPINWKYLKNTSAISVGTPRASSVDLSNVAEIDGRTSIVFYVHKTVATNQILDRYYYMNLYDKNGNLISSIRQINPDAERLYIGFYLENGVSDIGYVAFTHEDGSPAYVDETVEIGYR